MMENKELSIDALKAIMPKNQKTLITQKLVDKLNEAADDPKILDAMKDNFVSYANVLRDGYYSMTDYVNAVKFVTYKMLNYSDIDAWTFTFPDRVARLEKEGVVRKGMASYASMYKKNKLVTAIIEQTLVPSHILNAPLYQDALNELAKIMVSSRSDIARVNAASAILQHTKSPEVKKLELSIGNKEMDAIGELRKATKELAQAQRGMIENGSSAKDIAESTIIEAEIEEIE